jgi:hypothetical protein
LDLVAVKTILSDAPLQMFFQAALLTASENGYTIRELSDQLGVPRSTLHRWIMTARDRRKRIRPVEVTAPPVGARECNHRRLFSDKRKRVCLQCLLSNFEGSPELARNRNFDPEPEFIPRRTYKPGRLKGGKS